LQLFVGHRLGYGMPFLSGCDFAYHSGKERFTNYTVKTPEIAAAAGNAPPFMIPAEWERHDHPFVPPNAIRNQDRLAKTDTGLLSTEVMLYYKKNMISAWRLYGKTIYTTDHGSITEMPYLSVDKVVLSQGKKAKERAEAWNHVTAERYLAKVGAFIVENDTGGKNFIEADDPEVQLHAYMVNMSRQYQCELCGSVGVAEDGNSHAGEKCPVCSEGKQARRHSIDIEKNIARVRLLLKWVEKNGGAQTQFKPSTPAQGIAAVSQPDQAPAVKG
jgi:hypothetical protein